MTTTRIFQPGDRVEFTSLGNSSKLFRGKVEARLTHDRYSVIHDGERKGRPVAADRLRRCVSGYSSQGGDAA